MSQTGRFIDSFGFLWQVMEVALADARGASRELADVPGWLYFFSRGCTMVLRDYPADWQRLDWVGLDALRLRAEVLSSDVTRLPRATGVASLSLEAANPHSSKGLAGRPVLARGESVTEGAS